MALMQRMELRQGQSLVMTPQLQQAIKLLQMSNLELQAFVEGELERNPLLEREEPAGADKPEPRQEAEREPDLVKALDGGGPAETPGPTDSGWASLRPSGGGSFNHDELESGAGLARRETLAEHLDAQLNLAIADPADRLIGQHLIGMVNEAGYLTGDSAGVAEMLGTDVAHVERVLAILQDFDPTGVFARNPEECLTLQLKEAGRYDPAMAILVANLELVKRRDFAALKMLCKLDLDDVHDMIAELKRLNPWPGHAFGSEPVQPVIPDVFVRAAPDGTWLIELNSETLPKVLVNNRYLAQVSKMAAREEDKAYLSQCQANATWLVKSLDQRARTILKVAREIVRQQDAFLVLGVQHLKPINLRTVVDAIEMHESTVSRVTSNKYMATPRGTFELKYFFTTAIASSEAGGDAHSAESVRHRIKELIVGEATGRILSDDALVDLLKHAGIDIARRTVAKYRESLGIPSSIQRRREREAKPSQDR
jgi:RNA polymerase sigma-54 factor